MTQSPCCTLPRRPAGRRKSAAPSRPWKSAAGLLAALLWLAAPHAALGQGKAGGRPATPDLSDLQLEHLNVATGLSDAAVMDILQDRRGFLWFATRNGLNRYDGHGFKVFHQDPQNPYSLGHNDIAAIREDREGILWIGTRGGGLDRYDPASERFTHHTHRSADRRSIPSNAVQAIHEDRSGMLWVGTDQGLALLDRRTGEFTRYRRGPSDAAGPRGDDIRAIYEDSAGLLWIGTYCGLGVFDRRTRQVTRRYQVAPSPPPNLSSNFVERIFEDSQGDLWVATRGGLNRFDRFRREITVYHSVSHDPRSLSHNSIRAVHEDARGVLWVGTDLGLNVLERATGQWTRLQQEEGNPLSLSSNLIQAIAEDRTGTLWIGTFDEGGNRLDLEARQFSQRVGVLNGPGVVVDANISALFQDRQGRLWIGTSGRGLQGIDPMTGRQTVYRHSPDNPRSLGSDYVTSIVQDPADHLWVATYGGGLNRLDAKTGRITRYLHNPRDPASLSDNDVRQVCRGRGGVLWVGTLKGLDRFDTQTKSFVHYRHQPHNPYSLSSDDVSVLWESWDGALWVGTGGGLNRFDPVGGTFTRYRHNPNDPRSLVNNDVRTIHQDALGRLWIGTGDGLDRLDGAANGFVHLQGKEGLASRYIQSILEDDDSHLWLGTGDGLIHFDPQKQTFTHYDIRDGLADRQFNRLAALKLYSGEMLFGGPGGLNRFHPGRIAGNPHVPPVVLTDLKINGRPAGIGDKDSPLSRALNETESLVLGHDQSDLSLSFAALNYRSSDKNRYAYMLEGFDPEWRFADSGHRLAHYTGLKPGRYLFRVKAANNDGLWNETGKTLAITIRNPWWQDPWTRLAMALLLLGAVWWGSRWRVRAVTRRNIELERLIAERTREVTEKNVQYLEAKQQAEAASRAKSVFLANISHELRTPLNAILGYAQILQRREDVGHAIAERLKIIQHSGDHLLTLINELLDQARIEAGKIEIVPVPVHLPSFLTEVVRLIQPRVEAKGLSLSFEFRPQEVTGVLVDAKRLRQILLNLLGNAVKFTDRGGIGLMVETGAPAGEEAMPSQATLRFTVEDTGIGIAEDQQARLFQPFEQATPSGGWLERQSEGAGLGLAISQRIVELMGGRIRLHSVPERGSAFWFDLTLPVVELPTPGGTPAEAPLCERLPVGYEGPRRRVLVAEDKEYNRLVLADMLSPLGFEVIMAGDGREAVEKALAQPPDAVLMDLVMPVMTGLEAIQRLRQDPETARLVIIAISASVLESDRERSRVAGSDEFLPKPISLEALLAALERRLQLTWIYGAPKEAGEAAAGRQAALGPPPKEELAKLRALLENGDLRGLRERLETLAQGEASCRPFFERMQRMARGYEIKQIMKMLEYHLKENP